MARGRFSAEDFDRMAAMRERGDSYDAIGAAFGCSGKAVSWHCLRLAAEPPNPRPLQLNSHLREPMQRGNHVVRPFTPDEDARLVEMDIAGECITNIARALGRRWNSCRGRLMTLARRDARAEASAS